MKKVMMITVVTCLMTMFMLSCDSKTQVENDLKQKTQDSLVEQQNLVEQQRIQDSLSLVEQQRIQDSLSLLDLENFKNCIQLIKYYTSKPNSAGGVDCNVIWKNLSEKTVKYARFTVVPYNEVNDRVKGDYDYSNDGSNVLSVTGPIKQNQVNGKGTYWECIWYNWSINYMRIIQIEIEYLDGSIISTKDVNIIDQLGYNVKQNL